MRRELLIAAGFLNLVMLYLFLTTGGKAGILISWAVVNLGLLMAAADINMPSEGNVVAKARVSAERLEEKGITIEKIKKIIEENPEALIECLAEAEKRKQVK